MRMIGVLAVALTVAACGTGNGRAVPSPVVETTLLSGPSPTSAPDATTAPTGTGTTSTVSGADVEPAPSPALKGLSLTQVASVRVPVGFAVAPGDDRLFVVDKVGQVVAVDGSGATSVYLDVTDRVSDGFEQGLLGLAFAPDFEASGRLYVSYTDRSGDTIVAEYVDDGSGPLGSRVVFTADQPAGNHNGGSIIFGPDGFLYVGLGDGGAANDRFGNGQNTGTALGSIVRLAVGDEVGPAPGNPFMSSPGADEIWAYGVRNPWRLAIDDGLLIVPDVGQSDFEEITLIPLDEPGANLGWPLFEGLHCFRGPCDDAGLLAPVVEVPHGDAGTCSITGGVVYRGQAIPEWTGRYFYSDFCGGYLRSVTFAGATGQPTDHTDWTEEVGGPIGQVTVIGADQTGELLVGTGDGRVWRVDPIR